MKAIELKEVHYNLQSFSYQMFFRIDYLNWHLRLHDDKVSDLTILLMLYLGTLEKDKAYIV